MKIEVTQEDIDNGICGDPFNCMLALAFRRAGLVDAAVQPYLGHVFIKGVEWSLPQNARTNGALFDAGKDVSPFFFETEPIP